MRISSKINNAKNAIYSWGPKVAGLIPKSRRIWVYGAWSGRNYSDNPKYMFEYMCRYHPDIKSVWISRDNHVISKLRNAGFSAYNRLSMGGLYYTLRAGVAFETAGNEDISPFINNIKTKTIMMWHGVGGKSSKWKKGQFGTTTKFKFDYFPASSELYIKIMSEAKNVPQNQFCITGQARDDAFVNSQTFEPLEQIKRKNPESKLIVYMPTHRNFGYHENTINIEEIKRVDSFLRENQMIMIFKPHFNELKFYLSFEENLSNIIIAKDSEWSDPYEYLHYFDLMIGDYSSVMYDFLCADKPIVLYTYDIDDFIENDANLHDSYWKYPIGPMCNTWDEVFIKILEANKKDEWKTQREICKNKFHKFNDGNNCYRIYQWVEELLDS
ncbi:MAG: CDP-glycerol glycerophosphotransferase family protein [Clostridia bacterium]|nr:CDP-glycerol glycerophosphotransferase family protein [Clostridia bacterium]